MEPISRLGEPGYVKSDKFDRKIIHYLSQDSRQSFSSIAKKVRLSRDTVEYRIKRLVRKQVILGFVPIINLNYFGYDTFHVFMVVNDANIERKRLLQNKIINHMNTKSLMEYTDKWDLEWVLVAKSLHEFDDILTSITTEFSDVIVQKNKLEIIKGYKSIHLPQIFYRDQKEIRDLKVHVRSEVKYDEKDIKILRILAKNARASSYMIGDQLEMSANAIRNRIKKMQQEKIIWQFSIILNLSLTNLHWYSMNIEIKAMNKKSEYRFKAFVQQNPFIIRAVKVLGSWDLLVYIVSETMKDFHLTAKQLQEEFVAEISNYETLIAYKERIFNPMPRII